MLKGSFDKDAANAFTAALNDVLKIGIEKVVVKVGSEGNVKLTAKVPSESNFVVIDFQKNTLFNDFTFPSTPFEFGITNIAEFNGVARIFKDGFNLKLNPDLAVIEEGQNKYFYYPFRIRKEDQGPLRFASKVDPAVEFNWDDNMSSFIKAINSLSQEHIVFTGDKETGILDIAITNHQHKNHNKFSVKLDCGDIKETFRTIVQKELIQPVLTGSQEEFNVKIYPSKMILLTAVNDYFTMYQAVTFKRR